MTKLSWKTLDKLDSSQAIYESLSGSKIKELTPAEATFVLNFDKGQYPELDKEIK